MLDRNDPDEVVATRGKALAHLMTSGCGIEIGPDGFVPLRVLCRVLRGFDLREAREVAERSGGRFELRVSETGAWAMRFNPPPNSETQS